LVSLIGRETANPDAPSTEEAVARLAAGSLFGLQPLDLAARLFQAEVPDPMLGVLTAWRFDALGDLGSVQRIAAHFASSGHPVPFDIALLARMSAHRPETGPLVGELGALACDQSGSRLQWLRAETQKQTAYIAGIVPFTTAGWDLLDEDDELGFKGVETIIPHLRRSAPFTTLTPEGGRRLSDLLGFD
jgi:hypothetical protein